MEGGRTLIRIGDPSNAYIEEDGKCITFRIDSDFTDSDYDQTKYAVDDEDLSVTRYTESTTVESV